MFFKLFRPNYYIPLTEDLQYNLSAITVEEIQEVIRKLERNKATGPDDIPIETFKELEKRALEHVATALNIWWDDEAIEEYSVYIPVYVYIKVFYFFC